MTVRRFIVTAVTLFALAGCESKLRGPTLAPPEQVSVAVGPDLALVTFSSSPGAEDYILWYEIGTEITDGAIADDVFGPRALSLHAATPWAIAVSSRVGSAVSERSPTIVVQTIPIGPVFAADPDQVLPGEQGDLVGAVLEALDADGDGIDDLAIASGSTDGFFTLHRGTPEGLDAILPAFATPAQSADRFAAALARIDRNGDGLDDIAVGQPAWDGVGVDSGAFFWLLGSPDGLRIDTRIDTPAIGGFGGTSVAALGDLDGDGDDELACAEPGIPLIRIHRGFADGSPVPADDAFSVLGGPEPSLRLAGGGDLDGDGIGDLVVSAPGAGGYVGLHLGESTGLVDVQAAWSASGGAGSRFGESVAIVGDQDSDGRLDLAITAPDEGRFAVYEWSGAGMSVIFDSAGGPAWSTVEAAGDPDFLRLLGNRFEDLFVGDPDSGIVRLYLSTGVGTGYLPAWEATGTPGDRFGTAIAAGDFNGDGASDVAIGAPFEDVGAEIDAGEVRVWFARRYEGPIVTAGGTRAESAGVDVSFPGAWFSDPVTRSTHVCTWIWGDELPDTTISPCDPASVATATHVYAEPGLYHPRLRVTSPLGTGESVTTLRILPAGQQPGDDDDGG